MPNRVGLLGVSRVGEKAETREDERPGGPIADETGDRKRSGMPQTERSSKDRAGASKESGPADYRLPRFARPLDRQPSALGRVPVAPGTAIGFMALVQHCEDHFLPDLPRRHRPALAARPAVDNVRPLQGHTPTAFTLHHDTLWAPPVGLAEVLDFLDGVMTGNALYNPHLSSPFPAAYSRRHAALTSIKVYQAFPEMSRPYAHRCTRSEGEGRRARGQEPRRSRNVGTPIPKQYSGAHGSPRA